MKGYSAFPKAPALLEPHHQIVYCHIQDTHRGGGVLPLCKEAVGVFYSPSRLGKSDFTVHMRFNSQKNTRFKWAQGPKDFEGRGKRKTTVLLWIIRESPS